MALTYCGNIIRQQDSDRFLLSLFAPARLRPALWALFAFHYEIARTRESVSDTTIGLIRLQWWRDSIAAIYEGEEVARHEIMAPLAQAIKEHDLPRELFDNLIYAREFDLEDVLPANIEGLMKYCEYTNAPLVQLALKILGEAYNDTVVVDISMRYALIGVIRAVPYRLKFRQLLLPEDVLKQYNISPQNLFDLKGKEDLPKAIKKIFEGGEAYRKAQPAPVSSKFLQKMQQMAYLYEGQLKSVDFDVFHACLPHAPKFMALRLWVGR